MLTFFPNEQFSFTQSSPKTLKLIDMKKTKSHYIYSTLCFTFVYCFSAAQADTLIEFDFGTETPDESGETLSASTIISGATGSSISNGASSGVVDVISDVNTGLAIPGGTAASFPLLGASGYTTSFSSSHYFEFTLTPDSNFQFDLTSIDFDVASAGGGTREYRVEYSFDGFASSTVAGSGVAPNPGGGLHAFSNISYALNDESGEVTTSTITFRFLGATPSAAGQIRFDNISVQGTISAIPEPSTYALIGGVIALGLSVLIRKRK